MTTNTITIDNDNNAADAIDNGNGGVASVSPIRFNRGDLVHIHNAPSRFSNDCDAIVEGSYSDLYGRDYNSNHYSLFVRGKGLAEPFLRTGDKDGWLALCESITLGVVQ